MSDQPANGSQQETWCDAEDLRWAARHWATRIGVQLRQVSVRPMTTKWASMSTAGRLTISSELVIMPKHLGEFVIVHELVHLLAPSHGKVFTSFMAAYMPDWEERERQLQAPSARTRIALSGGNPGWKTPR